MNWKEKIISIRNYMKYGFRMSMSMMILVVGVSVLAYSGDLDDNPLKGKGTLKKPYLISNAEDLQWFRDSVNAGEEYHGIYFQQTCDIDLQWTEWTPIGVFNSGNYFYGIYDGDNHKIYNLLLSDHKEVIDNNGFFGQLGGVVINLGIESGAVFGECVGSFASHAVGADASIINCYNKALVAGNVRAGGICDNLSGGKIVNCANLGEVQAPQSAGIVSYDAQCIINVFSEEAFYIENTFSGECVQYVSNVYDLAEFLNLGAQYIKHDLLKEWPNQ